ncbi:hypothetical protein [Oleidesulfovibrio sp.]|uniref:hypothetical protein n=1 Tax=Oleidesulfovibrio sp. TaxID=2909707 RepID=UPI003A8357A0
MSRDKRLPVLSGHVAHPADQVLHRHVLLKLHGLTARPARAHKNGPAITAGCKTSRSGILKLIFSVHLTCTLIHLVQVSHFYRHQSAASCGCLFQPDHTHWYVAGFDGTDLFYGIIVYNDAAIKSEWWFSRWSELLEAGGVELDCMREIRTGWQLPEQYNRSR